jgi:hypothetical protein
VKAPGKSRRGRYSGAVARLRVEWGDRCKRCGKPNRMELDGQGRERPSLDFAHVKPTGVTGRSRGSAHRYHDIKANPECYQLLCRYPCHKDFDRDYWARKRAEDEAAEVAAQAEREVEGPPSPDRPALLEPIDVGLHDLPTGRGHADEVPF